MNVEAELQAQSSVLRLLTKELAEDKKRINALEQEVSNLRAYGNKV